MSSKKKNLVIVESPAKARTLSKILGSSYSIKASIGHVRDLPRSGLGVDIENGFKPSYVVPRAKTKSVNELKKAGKEASTIYLATDPDREGEAISWHLATLLKANKKTFRRVVFHEITEEAINQAFKHPRRIDMQLVDAQQARRVLDRLVGYKISPLLWKKVRRGLSAGRVQSVALRIIVDRESQIESFVPAEYWTIDAELVKKTAADSKEAFRAALIGLTDGTKLDIANENKANQINNRLEQADYSVDRLKTRKVTRQPAPPFITSTLQQEAWYRLRFSAGQTMAIAQQLYEGLPVGSEGSVGLITYMRTDSTRVARSAIVETREFAAKKYGPEFIPPRARTFFRSVKRAQEAHEAIRPTRIHREPSLVKPYLASNQFRLYELIWKRMVASQMSAAIYDNTTVDIEADCPEHKDSYLLRASSSVNRFPGFTILYTREEGKDEEEKRISPLPKLEKGDQLNLLGLFPEQHFTQPPPRFTEATLIRMLEEQGIGRPSTYAPILSAIQGRGYVTKSRGSLEPTELGTVVNGLVSSCFPDIVDSEFTAHMEDELDEIAQNNKAWVDVVREFYTPFEKSLNNAFEQVEKVSIPDELTEETCPDCGKPLAIKTGRYGKFLACSGYPDCKFTRSYQLKTGASCPRCGAEILQRINRKGRTFYGCSGYPDCRFATNYRPLPEPCPECGGLLTEYRETQAKCNKCSYRGKLPEPKTAAGAR